MFVFHITTQPCTHCFFFIGDFPYSCITPKWDEATPCPSGEPTTTKAKRVSEDFAKRICDTVKN